jgi:hypothetical protein
MKEHVNLYIHHFLILYIYTVLDFFKRLSQYSKGICIAIKICK